MAVKDKETGLVDHWNREITQPAPMQDESYAVLDINGHICDLHGGYRRVLN